MQTDPEYSFDEMIELIRVADKEDLPKLTHIITRDKKEYSFFHLEILIFSYRLKKSYFVLFP